MRKESGNLCYSPSDLTVFMESPFASWMDRFRLEKPDQAPPADPEDPLDAILQRDGYAHEDSLEAQLKAEGRDVRKVEGEGYADKLEHTLQLMREGCEIITQGRLELGQFSGFADFLVKVPGESALGDYHYEVWDTKLSRTLRPKFVIQLCCYAEMLEAVQGRMPDCIAVVLGNGQHERLRTGEYLGYYQNLKREFLQAQQRFDPAAMPDPADSRNHGRWSSYAKEWFIQNDHLSQVANITHGQIRKLKAAGIHTMADLAASQLPKIKGMQDVVLAKLKAQAEIQQTSKGKVIPDYRLLPAKADAGLSLLPPPSRHDLFFDIEGYPLVDGGLEYLWGCTYFDETGQRQFRDFWAHDAEQEKEAFVGFIRWAYARWQEDPAMHIYHYANYEISACRKLMGRYGVCEKEVDDLLRNHVFVDLYKIVKGALLVGEPRYSIKNIEHLYRGKRATDVTGGADSVAVYDQWREAFAAGKNNESWGASELLRNIRDYNIDDCNSTQELVDWLRAQQAQHGIAYSGLAAEVIGQEDEAAEEKRENILRITNLRDQLLEKGRLCAEEDPGLAEAIRTVGWSLEFFQREDKPAWWKFFERDAAFDDELLDDPDCLAECQRTEREPYTTTAKQRNKYYEYRFPAQEMKLPKDEQNFYLKGCRDENGKPMTVTYIGDESQPEQCLIIVKAKEEPKMTITLLPSEVVKADPKPGAIRSVAEDVDNDLAAAWQRHAAIMDFLARRKPNIKSHAGGPIITGQDDAGRLQQIIRAVERLDKSYLAIQGPPGAGKTYTATRIIAALLAQGKKIGIASNSHHAINNLLFSTAAHCREKGIAATFSCGKETEQPRREALGVSLLKNDKIAAAAKPACVIGTTAWGFARDDMAGKLDYLFVDEAGQVATANLIAMSRAASNLVLMGDQMQLGQPTQGTHPETSGLSVLDYLLRDTPTIPDDMGIFLGTTYRMHPAVNRFISDGIYEGKLTAADVTQQRTIRWPASETGYQQQAGILFVPVAHEGNTQASEEEAAAIRDIAMRLLSSQFVDQSTGITRPLGWNDMLFVAPYNLQVMALRKALGPDARVGSVDKFQGQEAPVVFLSMCASDASESPRGVDFLFDRHRLNVAVSRAQCLAIVVANPGLGRVAANNIRQMGQISLYQSLVEYAGNFANKKSV